MKEINEQYVLGYLLKQGVEDLPQESIATLMATMKKYGDNRWWESDDIVTLAYHQLHENISMINLETVYQGASKICGRSVYTHDLVDTENLIKEVELGMKRLKRGIILTEEAQEAAVEASIGRLEKKLKERGGRVIRINVATEEVDNSGYDGWLNPK